MYIIPASLVTSYVADVDSVFSLLKVVSNISAINGINGIAWERVPKPSLLRVQVIVFVAVIPDSSLMI